jgi:hypothetical protein
VHLAPVALALWLGGSSCVFAQSCPLPAPGSKLALPPPGLFYHGVYPGGKTGEEDDLTAADVLSYQDTVGQQVAWVYFSDNWYRSRAFPVATCTWIRGLGSVPFVRLMLRSKSDEVSGAVQKAPAPPFPPPLPLPLPPPAPLPPAAVVPAGGGPPPAEVVPPPPPPKPVVIEPVFTLPAIIEGQFDDDLRAWARAAQAFGTPIIVEWGTEMNGDWFQWNGKYWGAGQVGGFGDPTKPEGPQRFVAAYRHIVTVMRSAGATNLTWVFHVNADDEPDEDWSHLENYYPGDDVVDWLGVSGYGCLTPKDKDKPDTLETEMCAAYPRLAALTPDKPIFLLEFGTTAGNKLAVPEDWAQEGLDHLFAHRWPRVRGFSWWNEHWENDNNPADDTTMRVQDIPALATVFHDTLANNLTQLQTRPIYSP